MTSKFKRTILVVALLCGLPGLVSCGGDDGQGGPESRVEVGGDRGGGFPRPPNVIVIMMDTMRPDHLGLYGYGRATSPRLDALASESTVFTNARSTSTWTIPAHASLFTGLLPNRTGVRGADVRLSLAHRTLAETLAEHGYETVAFVANPVIRASEQYDQGFETYLEVWRREYSQGAYDSIYPKGLALPEGQPREPDDSAGYRLHTDLDVVRQFEPWLKERADTRPFFLFVNLIGTHAPFDSSGPFWDAFLPSPAPELDDSDFSLGAEAYYLGRESTHPPDTLARLIDLYDAEVLHMDFVIGKIIDLLEEERVLDNTLLIVTSDHGENIGDHGFLSHCFSLYDSTTRVALIVREPGGGGRTPPRRSARTTHRHRSDDLSYGGHTL